MRMRINIKIQILQSRFCRFPYEITIGQNFQYLRKRRHTRTQNQTNSKFSLSRINFLQQDLSAISKIFAGATPKALLLPTRARGLLNIRQKQVSFFARKGPNIQPKKLLNYQYNFFYCSPLHINTHNPSCVCNPSLLRENFAAKDYLHLVKYKLATFFLNVANLLSSNYLI